MKCSYCGFESPANFEKCPSCGQPQPTQPVASAPAANPQAVYPSTVPYTPPAYTPPAYHAGVNATSTKGMTGGETASIIIAIIVSIISLILAFVLFVTYAAMRSDNLANDGGEFGIDAFDDSDSNDYLDDFFDNYYNNKDSGDKYSLVSPADLHTPIDFEDDFYSFSEGFVKTEYEVELDETYRGEAALKLLEGAALPDYDKDTSEMYLVRFKVKITQQDKDAIVSLYYISPSAINSTNQTLSYDPLNLNYKDNIALMSKDQEGYRWLAFVVDKADQKPLIMWNKYDERYFQNSGESISDPAGLEAGGAMDQNAGDDAKNNTNN